MGREEIKVWEEERGGKDKGREGEKSKGKWERKKRRGEGKEREKKRDRGKVKWVPVRETDSFEEVYREGPFTQFPIMMASVNSIECSSFCTIPPHPVNTSFTHWLHTGCMHSKCYQKTIMGWLLQCEDKVLSCTQHIWWGFRSGRQCLAMKRSSIWLKETLS